MEINQDNAEPIRTLEQDAIVIANAGAGKTTLLVEHYFEILSLGFDPAGVIAFTFTEKAAGEMKERIFQRFSSHPHFADLPPDILQDWKGRTWKAPIGTIHEFCLKIILEALGPERMGELRIVEEASEAPVRERAIRDVLVENLRTEDPGALALLQHFGIAPLKRLIREYLEASLHPHGEGPLLPQAEPNEAQLLAALETLARPIRARIDLDKAGLGWINFDDMERRALELLREPPPQLKKRLLLFSHALVDEFQDTSPIQIEILETLRATLKRLKRPFRLFFVGDPKQSIYRFRKVDRNLIQKVEQAILGGGGKRYQSVKNYRSSPHLINFLNLFSARAFPEASPSEAVLPADPDSRVWVTQVELPEGESSAEAYRAQEARWVAVQIAQLLKEGKALSDIAVLARYSASFLALTAELKRHGIPFSLRGGQELLERQEVLDLFRLLQFLSKPGDEISLVGILRSPLFLISDATLLYLKEGAGDEGLWDYLKSGRWEKALAGKAPDETAKLKWILPNLKYLLGLSRSLAPSQLLTRWMEERELGPLYAFAEQDRDAYLALEQFVDWLRLIEEENQNPRLEAVVGILKGFQRLGIHKAPLGNLIETQHCLRLSTLHAAKGLEFDTVFLIGLERRGPNATEKLIHAGAAFALKIPDAETGADRKTPRFEALEAFHQEEEAEENKRLLYVALTRAKQRLILTLHPKPASSKCLQKLLLDLMGEGIEAFRQPFSLPPLPVGITGAPELQASPRKAPGFAERRQKPESTVSELELFQLCPVKHHLAARCRIPDTSWQNPLELGPAEKGTLLHAALRRLSLHPGEGIKMALKTVGQALLPWPQDALLEDLAEAMRLYLAGPAAERLKAAREDYSEVPFLLELHAGRVRGQIDRLIHDRDGGWRLIDFKFLTRSASEAEIRVAYGFQLKTYALAAQKILSQAPTVCEIHLLGSQRLLEFNFQEEELTRHRAFLEDLLLRLQSPDLEAVRQHSGCFSCAYREKIPLCGIPQGRPWSESDGLWT